MSALIWCPQHTRTLPISLPIWFFPPSQYEGRSFMPPKKASRPPPSPELHEPYESYLYADLRHELSVRHIRIPRSGQCLNTRVGFIQQLRDWDQEQTQTPETPRRTSPRRNQSTNQTQMNSTRVIRARRGCRFRLINVLLSPEFNRRWNEMVSRGGKMEVNRLWLDVHAAFIAQNSALDALHFQDALFVNITPNVILAHSVARLQQMWIEIVAMYRNAVAQAKEAAAHNDNVHSFFDFCAGRLDLLYLHMAMLLEPKLYEFVMSGKLSAAEPFNTSKAKTKAVTTTAQSTQATTAADSKPGAAITAAAAKAKAAAPIPAATASAGKAKAAAPIPAKAAAAKAPIPAKVAAAKAKAAAPIPATTEAVAPTTKAAVTTAATQSKPPGVLMQNPEMKEPLSPAVAKSSATAKTAAVKAHKSSTKAKQAKPTGSPQKPATLKKVQKAAGKGKAPVTAAPGKETKPKVPVSAASAKETKPKASPSKQKLSASPSKLKVASKPALKKSSVGDKPAQTTSHGKRKREEEDTTVVEVPTVSDIVRHSGNKRVHTTTTTISTALATRPTDMMLPPDEWDILESRLRKVNENIDRCHRGLSSVEGNVSDSYKQSLEADLRFYSAIKQRLQEQLLVVMQSGY